MHSLATPFLFAAVVAVASSPLLAQCTNAWLPGDGLPGTNGPVLALTAWDADGSGPAPARLVAGGQFTVAGNVLADRLAVWDPAMASWSSIGAVGGGEVFAVLALPNGHLVVGGSFSSVGGVAAARIARWDGTTWTSFGTGMNQDVRALAALPNGDVVAGGAFTSAGGGACNRIARWNGAAWSPLANGTDDQVNALAVLANGNVVAGGAFLNAGGTAASRIAQWNGASWSGLGTGCDDRVSALLVRPNGDLVAAGSFTTAGGVAASRAATWTGSSWSALGAGFAADVVALANLANGDVVAGPINAGGGPMRWDGTAWQAMTTSMNGWTLALATMPNGDLMVGGTFTRPDQSIAGLQANRIARWDAAGWSSLGTLPPVNWIQAFARFPDGTLAAGGAFAPGGLTRVALWDGNTMQPLGPVVANVRTLVALPNGDVVVGGNSVYLGGFYNCVGRWDGTTWSPLGSQVLGEVYALALLPGGDIVAGGDFSSIGSLATSNPLARWNGTAWVAMGASSPSGSFVRVEALAVMPNGDVVAGGVGSPPGNAIAQWNGTAWLPVGGGGGFASVNKLVVSPQGDLLAAGVATGATFPNALRIARWDGASWTGLGSIGGGASSMECLPNGDVVVSGVLTVGGVNATVARWNGVLWSALPSLSPGTGAWALAIDRLGNLVAGGTFQVAGPHVSSGFARLTTTCPAGSQSLGAGCAGNLVTSTLPWTGSTWRADASGLPSAAAVFVVNGFATASLPLTAVFPTALPGCTLHVQPDYVDMILAVNGTASVQFALPNTPALAGTVFHHQMVPIALDATLAVTATNSLQLTVGSF